MWPGGCLSLRYVALSKWTIRQFFSSEPSSQFSYWSHLASVSVLIIYSDYLPFIHVYSSTIITHEHWIIKYRKSQLDLILFIMIMTSIIDNLPCIDALGIGVNCHCCINLYKFNFCIWRIQGIGETSMMLYIISNSCLDVFHLIYSTVLFPPPT